MIVGIDLGTAFSSIAFVHEEGIPTLVADAAISDEFRTPSVVAIVESCGLVGRRAIEAIEDFPNVSVARMFKSQLGSGVPVVRDALQRNWSAEALLALILAKLRNDFVGRGLGFIDSAVIAVPASFTDQQRRAVRRSADLIGLRIQSLVDAPIAAARFLVDAVDEPQTVLICDLGAGGLEASLVHCSQAGLSVLASDSDPNLGMREITQAIAQRIAAHSSPAASADSDASYALAAIEIVAQRFLDHRLRSPEPVATLQTFVAGNPITLHLTQSELEQLAGPIIEQAIAVCRRCIESAGQHASKLDRVYLIGGGSLLPEAGDRLAAGLAINRERIHTRHTIDAIAYGAAWVAADSGRPGNPMTKHRSACAFDLGIRIRDPRTNRTAIYKLIKRNASLPSRAVKVFKTSRIDQERMIIEVVQVRGEAETAISLGDFSFGPLHPQSANHPIEISIECDREGMVHVSARDVVSDEKIHRTVAAVSNHKRAAETPDPDQQLVDGSIGRIGPFCRNGPGGAFLSGDSQP